MYNSKWCAKLCDKAAASLAQASDGDIDSSMDDGAKLQKKAIAAEFLAMTLFVIIGCGSACGIAKADGSAWVLQVALTFGFAITVLAYTIGHISGGQINCAVTFGLVMAGKLSVAQGVCNFFGQMAGSVTGAFVLRVMYPADSGKDLTGGLGSNGVGEGWSWRTALIGEVVGTFLLMFVVFETALDPGSLANRALAPVAIGLAVFLAHSVLIPIDGCSINPTRSFGPAVVAMLSGNSGTLKDMWIFWLGPLTGASLAVCAYKVLVLMR
jgi:MIP family channel proteins